MVEPVPVDVGVRVFLARPAEQRDVEVELELPDGARVVAGEAKSAIGQLKGRVDKRSTTWWANDESTNDRVKLEWVVEAPAGTEIGVEARQPRAGTVRRRIPLR